MWAARLERYADALQAARALAPADELAPLSRAAPPAQRVAGVPRQLLQAAGFKGPVGDPQALRAPLRQLAAVLDAQLEALAGLLRELAEHPVRGFAPRAEEVLGALCRFELARGLHRNGAMLRASERLVSDLLQDRLAPIVRELVAAIVRFEWYFKPLIVPDSGRKIVLGGLATESADLDARLMLNSAERTAVGLAWFLARHLLQPPQRRRVIVLDDPGSIFDPTNQAGFASTLRAFLRLTKPDQVVVAAHEDHVAVVLAEELAPVDGWPVSVARLRCRRDGQDCSVVTQEWSTASSTSVESEAQRLGLRDEAPAAR